MGPYHAHAAQLLNSDLKIMIIGRRRIAKVCEIIFNFWGFFPVNYSCLFTGIYSYCLLVHFLLRDLLSKGVCQKMSPFVP